MMAFDASVIEAFKALWQKTAILDWSAVFFATYFPFLILLLVLALFFQAKSWRLRLWYIANTTLAVVISRGIITEGIRFLYARPRPFIALRFSPLLSEFNPSPAFPSGHAATLFAVAFILLFFRRKWGYWFLGFAFINALARVYAGVHWPTDIIGGILTGFISASVVWFLLLRNNRKIVLPKEEESEEEKNEEKPGDSLFPKISE